MITYKYWIDQREADIIMALSVVTIGFLLYYFISRNEKIGIWINTRFAERNSSIAILFQRLSGFIFLGILPVMVTLVVSGNSLLRHVFSLGNLNMAMLFTATVSLIIVILNVFIARSPDNLAMYPQIRVKYWTTWLLVSSTIAWVAYLVAYEALFRGILLFTFEMWFGPIVAITVNVAIYSLVHIHKGSREAFGAIPFGILICWITLQTGSIWSAVVIHIVMALSNEYLSLYFHPEISMKR